MESKRDEPPSSTWMTSSRLLRLLSTLAFFSACAWVLYGRPIDVTQVLKSADLLAFTCDPQAPVQNVAIIGAGSAGSSAAFYLHKYTQGCDRVHVTIFERSSYIGGRSTTVNAFDSPSEPVELGASIFVQVNHNIVSAVERFGLSTSRFGSARVGDDDEESDLGIWDGTRWVFYQNNEAPSWWNAAKILWKYGMAPLRTRNLMKSTVGKFLQMYDPPHFPFRDLSETAYELGLIDVTAVNGEEFLANNNIAAAFGRDIIQASTRVNYAQNLDKIHGLETMVCMATDGAMSVAGGNWQIFEGMVRESKAALRLNTTVMGVTFLEDGKYDVKTSAVTHSASPPLEASASASASPFDQVILAGPYQFADLTLDPNPQDTPSIIPYVKLHVTLFTSPFLLNPQVFNLDPTDHVPSTVLTTTNPDAAESSNSPPFYSISNLRTLTNPSTGAREHLYKIFSPRPLSRQYIHSLLTPSSTSNTDSELGHTSTDESITWIHKKIWHSYPVESPRVTFESSTITLDGRAGGGSGGISPPDSSSFSSSPCQERSGPKGKIWYTAGIESFISTMETSSLMGMNVARMIVDEWIEERKRMYGPEDGDGNQVPMGNIRGVGEENIEEMWREDL